MKKIVILEFEDYQGLVEEIIGKFVLELGPLENKEGSYYVFCVGDEKFTYKEALNEFNKQILPHREDRIPDTLDESIIEFTKVLERAK